MISQPDRYEPKLSATVQDFARHYGCSILPARPQRPQDKAKVESAVQVVERWIMMRLRHQRFETVDEVNAAIEPLLEYLNTRPFQKLPGSRATAFAQLDAPALQPLPAQSWELAVFKSVRVHIDQHVEFEGHRYSVPTALVGQVLELRVTAKVVEVLHRGARVTSHMRCAHKGGYSTQVEHLSLAHRKHLEWTPQRLVHWAQSIGSATGALVERLLASHRHPEHGYRSCLGLLSLARRFSEARLEAACEVALGLGTCRYQHVKDILQNGRDKAGAPVADKWQSPEHAHVRGAKYYQ
jgi:transposase